MTLGLEIEVRRTGRATLPVTAAIERELTLADVEALGDERETAPRLLKRVSDRHHSLARLVASGMEQDKAALVVGYEPARVSILKRDPMFQELVEFYRSQESKTVRDLGEKLAGIASDALDEIADRLEDEEERKKISLTNLMKLGEMGADRTGFGPSSTQTNVNIHVGLADRLAAARKRAREATSMIDVTPGASAE
jgi:hypothetical protein